MEMTVAARSVGLLGVGLAGERAVIDVRTRFSSLVTCHTWSTHATHQRVSQTLRDSLRDADVIFMVVDGSMEPAALRLCMESVLDGSRLINTVVLSPSATDANSLANVSALRPASSMLTITRDESYLDALLQALGVR